VNTLLIGPGTSRRRFLSEEQFGDRDDEAITVLDRGQAVLDFWEPYAKYLMKGDVRDLVLPESHFDEAHAYEVLNLLPGDEKDFFRLWRRLWACMRPGGKVMATVPHYASQWVHAYPAPQRTYTLGLLYYLDHEVKVTAKENFDELWPLPYNFTLESAYDVGQPPQGFYFTLVKR
jgi:hypothetical protein